MVVLLPLDLSIHTPLRRFGEQVGRTLNPSGGGRYVPVAFCLLVFCWGSSFAFVKLGLESAPPVLFAGMRALLGGAAMLLVALARGESPGLRSNWRQFALLALLNVVLFIGLQTYTIEELPSGLASILVYLQPILVGVLAWLMLGEGLSSYKVAGLLLGFAGIAVVSLGGLADDAGGISVPGVVLGVASALSWAIGTVYFKRVQMAVSPLLSVAVPFVVGGAALTGAGVVVEGAASVEWSESFIVCLLYSSFAGISTSWAIWFSLVGRGEASRVSAYIFVVPLVAISIGVVFLGEPLHATLLLGAALVVLGIFLVNRSPGRGVKPGHEPPGTIG